MKFKLIVRIFPIVMFFCTISVTDVCGQKIVIGHMTAEVIEPVNASSSIVTEFAIKNKQVVADSSKQVVGYWNSESLNLGTFTINPGESMACNIKFSNATVLDNKGDCFTIVPSTLTSGNSGTMRADGIQTLSLDGTASLTSGLASGFYKGSYTLNVIFN
jgi:hypothetical protein